jgi:signal transduction histidine kinase
LQNKNNAKGIGLLNINNRVDAYNGTLKIETTEGNGFKLQVIFPIEDEKKYDD